MKFIPNFTDQFSHTFCYCSNSNRRPSRKQKLIDWRARCREILEVIWNSSDSVPFREPVDSLEHPGKFDRRHQKAEGLSFNFIGIELIVIHLILPPHQTTCKSSTHQWICELLKRISSAAITTQPLRLSRI